MLKWIVKKVALTSSWRYGPVAARPQRAGRCFFCPHRVIQTIDSDFLMLHMTTVLNMANLIMPWKKACYIHPVLRGFNDHLEGLSLPMKVMHECS